MQPLTLEWVEKAEADFNTANREFGAAKSPNYDAACFHAQQCIEKYLKALLVEADKQFPKTHDLDILLRLVIPVYPACQPFEGKLEGLSDMAVEVRYPGVFAEAEDAREALELTKWAREIIRSVLGLE